MITIKQVSGPSDAFVYLEAVSSVTPHVTRRRSISCAALADGRVSIAAEKAALLAEAEQAVTNWQAAQAALQEI